MRLDRDIFNSKFNWEGVGKTYDNRGFPATLPSRLNQSPWRILNPNRRGSSDITIIEPPSPEPPPVGELTDPMSIDDIPQGARMARAVFDLVPISLNADNPSVIETIPVGRNVEMELFAPHFGHQIRFIDAVNPIVFDYTVFKPFWYSIINNWQTGFSDVPLAMTTNIVYNSFFSFIEHFEYILTGDLLLFAPSWLLESGLMLQGFTPIGTGLPVMPDSTWEWDGFYLHSLRSRYAPDHQVNILLNMITVRLYV
jgi:hypothetical protein